MAADTKTEEVASPEGRTVSRNQTLTAVLGEAVGVLMRDQHFRHMPLMDLEWMVLPALASNQFMMMRRNLKPPAPADGSAEGAPAISVPTGIAIWARVSDEVSDKLERQKLDRSMFHLAPHEWRSGEHVWILALVGPRAVLGEVRQQLLASFNGRSVSEFYTVRAAPASAGSMLGPLEAEAMRVEPLPVEEA